MKMYHSLSGQTVFVLLDSAGTPVVQGASLAASSQYTCRTYFNGSYALQQFYGAELQSEPNQ